MSSEYRLQTIFRLSLNPILLEERRLSLDTDARSGNSSAHWRSTARSIKLASLSASKVCQTGSG